MRSSGESGTNTACATSTHADIDSLPSTETDIDTLIPLVPTFDRDLFLEEGRDDLARRIGEAFDLLIYGRLGSPTWSLYGLLGYEGMMVFLAQEPELASYAGERILKNTRQTIRTIER